MSAPAELLVERIQRLRTALSEKGNIPMLVTDPANVGWLSGIPADFQKDAHLLVTQKKTWFITDGRYENRIPVIDGLDSYIWGTKHPHRYPELKELLEGSDSLLLDVRGLPLDMYQAFPKMLGIENMQAPPGFIDRLRMIKGELELKLIREAVDLAIRQFNYIINEWLPENFQTATDMDLRDALEAWPMDKGADGVSFDALVAMDGDADTPHPDMTREAKPLKDGKVMLIDWGITYKGVCTDMTRMIVFGDELPIIHNGMKMLQETWMRDVIAGIEPGQPAYKSGNAYNIGMKVAGIEKPFHSAGHGTGGAYVHELPRLGAEPEDVDDFGIPFAQSIILEPGMIVTSEPGMYEREVGAYRTENMVLVTEDGHDILDKDLSLEPFYVKL